MQPTETRKEVLLVSAVVAFPQKLGSFSNDDGDGSENITV